ncbi:hypothetical protein KOR34_31590 [Posidoniimonas corsicana]|uniref:Uncharacterized protein n=1 Tax=Posidoniimonas corsicana TaxID=1938618 RepID=A0A5C5VJD3_9BACT|nr:hypothetical protein [Posidoniimonas corsicana]TWT38191.1 hypothetical protein KOR34_31590 [Posidoniimonas corsicana]
MSYEQPRPSIRRLALLERRPRRLQDVNWREIHSAIAFAGAAYVPVAVAARLWGGRFGRTPLGWLDPQTAWGEALAVVGLAGLGYFWFLIVGALVLAAVAAVFALSGTPVRQDWLAGFIAGGAAVTGVLPICGGVVAEPADFFWGPVAAVMIIQPAATYVATRELKSYVRGAFWSADSQIIASRRSMNLQISLAAMFGVTAVASFVMGLLRLSGLLDVPAARLLLGGLLAEVLLLPLSVWASHRLLERRFPMPAARAERSVEEEPASPFD